MSILNRDLLVSSEEGFKVEPSNTVFKRAAIATLGCKVNTFESEYMAQGLRENNWQVVAASDKADLYVVNSCTVTSEADRQTRQIVGRLLRLNPEAKIIVTGCYAQNDSEGVAQIPGVAGVLGNDQKIKLVDFIHELEGKKNYSPNPLIRIDRLSSVPPPLLNGFESRTRAFVQIQQGCDQSCTFCVIHRARGLSKSMNMLEILHQIKTFVKSGYKEIVLCGVDLGSFESGIEKKSHKLPIVDLMKTIASMDGDFRIRLSSIDPFHMSDDLFHIIAESDRFCPYLHVSLQSGSTLILKRMKRRYDREFLLDRLDKANKSIPNLVIGADIMTGFPTESDSDFEKTYEVVAQSNVIYPHVFSFSARPGTPASRIPKQIPREIRKARAKKLRELGKRMRFRQLKNTIGKQGILLVENNALEETGKSYHGRLANYMPVRINNSSPSKNSLVKVQVTDVDGDILIAQEKRC